MLYIYKMKNPIIAEVEDKTTTGPGYKLFTTAQIGVTCFFATPFTALIMIALNFKAVNDEFGHATGDTVIKMIARILLENSETGDYVCRLGGEEFGVLLPRCEERAAKGLAELYRHKTESSVLHQRERRISVTISCGVAQANPGASQSDLMERADAALYAAKRRGRNQTCIDGDVDEEKPTFECV